jgi:hypothetical protein
LPDADKDFIITAIPLLHPYDDIHGSVDHDEKYTMYLLGADLLNTIMPDYSTKPMNRQRAIVLNTESSIQLEQDLYARRWRKQLKRREESRKQRKPRA